MKNLFEIGDIVRIVATPNFPLSFHKHEFVNKTGFIVKFDERYNDFSGLYVKLFDSGQTILFHKNNLIKEADFLIEQNKNEGYFYEIS
jgi:hypothetical protein